MQHPSPGAVQVGFEAGFQACGGMDGPTALNPDVIAVGDADGELVHFLRDAGSNAAGINSRSVTNIAYSGLRVKGKITSARLRLLARTDALFCSLKFRTQVVHRTVQHQH